MAAAFYWGLVLFFTVVFSVFLAVAYSVLLGLRDNYYRYYQKSDLQWTAPVHRQGSASIKYWWFIGLGMIAAWLVVDLIIQPR